MTAPSTFALYRQLAEQRPAKASRYRRSILDTLERTTIHPIERDRLTDALAGIAAGLGEHPTCQRCHRELTDPESIERGYGPDCYEQMAAVAS